MIFISVSIYQLCSANSALSKYFVRGIIVISKGYLRDQRSLVTCVTDGGRRIPFRIFFIFMWSVFGNLNKLQFAKLDIDQQQTATNFHFTKTIHIPQIFEKYLRLHVWHREKVNPIYNILSAHNEVFWW